MRAAWTLASSLSRRSQQHAGGLLLCWTWPSWYALSPEQHCKSHQGHSWALESTEMGLMVRKAELHSVFALPPCQICVAETFTRSLACCFALQATLSPEASVVCRLETQW